MIPLHVKSPSGHRSQVQGPVRLDICPVLASLEPAPHWLHGSRRHRPPTNRPNRGQPQRTLPTPVRPRQQPQLCHRGNSPSASPSLRCCACPNLARLSHRPDSRRSRHRRARTRPARSWRPRTAAYHGCTCQRHRLRGGARRYRTRRRRATRGPRCPSRLRPWSARRTPLRRDRRAGAARLCRCVRAFGALTRCVRRRASVVGVRARMCPLPRVPIPFDALIYDLCFFVLSSFPLPTVLLPFNFFHLHSVI
jgi:hypothetical protein